ncbi:unnamed protein product [Strongylus vulgaris]|uniref:Partial AB-hydrolase lipase domain-containing protein n=1 Tax=Strongylus vulgaris TaxID=40348 RepID=A0A3P7LD34_STRVU|nr:unnamed protein product [Strongylus vulgaris]
MLEKCPNGDYSTYSEKAVGSSEWFIIRKHRVRRYVYSNFITFEWDNPCFVKTKPEIIQYWGYPVEVHKVLTMDGYILTLHRIPYGRIEVHKVLTMDGYILTLHRIPYGKSMNGCILLIKLHFYTSIGHNFKMAFKIIDCRQLTANRPVIFLQSGLLCSSAHWVLNLPHQSAGFVFADECFDVWLGNMRGNVYSKEHIRLNSLISDFWKFRTVYDKN